MVPDAKSWRDYGSFDAEGEFYGRGSGFLKADDYNV